MQKRKLFRVTTVPISLYALLRGQLRYMSDHFDVWGISSFGKELQLVEEEEEVCVSAVEMSRKITPFQDLKSLWKMWLLFRREKPCIVHTHTPKAGLIGMLASKLAGVPIRLHTVAGLPLMETKGGKRKLLDFVEKLTYACATKVYPNSKGLYDFIVEQKYTSIDKLSIIANGSSNGINTTHFSPKQISEELKKQLRKELDIKDTDFVYIFVGRLVGDKGINELIKAFKQIQKQNIKLLLVGAEERDLDPLKTETIQEIERNKNIIAVGFQKDVRPYFAIADALVFPSYREGFPNVVMQAGAMGLPSIVSNINGCNEIIENNKNGLIVPSKDVESLRKAMQIIIDDDNLYLRLKENSREMIVSCYQREFVWEELLKEYNKLIRENV
ncbi:glycosyltransferase family 4 protein [Riemerella anatipestifer]|uniref:Glycosyl transferase group 1 n=2 Tax=Riemerella anatipestifer TaxID=34085 RepID=E4TA15_RIEAD|nr:glycosyltransferase family 4 protein [Riemerella anatipestifer]ADQ81912.1 glycosyl transferase group 1 [Riemerella anatipestifer ATCC 11845 = DSM 15868]AFD55918.1 glycosyl transferase group 1 [Riemerella anatipestifer ATCC 11845 = DSM 15868]AIH02774.1 glycosyl transferase group 1 [Riemerella anatipestifer CH3]AZZ59271.1 glycosyltransferase family 1 protein [Riemerella anatipestifer]MCO7317926.1 glycosyltransferase family 4 protein [Riemerella anatipestifer]